MWHDFFAQRKLASYFRPNSGSEASTWWGRTCMDAARFVSLALMGCCQDGWESAYFQVASRRGESEATWLQPDHWQDGFMKWKENGNSWITPNDMIPAHGPLPLRWRLEGSRPLKVPSLKGPHGLPLSSSLQSTHAVRFFSLRIPLRTAPSSFLAIAILPKWRSFYLWPAATTAWIQSDPDLLDLLCLLFWI